MPDDSPDDPTSEPSKQALGGMARAEKLTSEERRTIASEAAKKRWSEASRSIPRATHSGTLNIGDALIPCSVLEDGTRLLTQQGFLSALGRSTKPKGRSQQASDGLPPFLATISLKPLITEEIIAATVPVIFRTPPSGCSGRISISWRSSRSLCRLGMRPIRARSRASSSARSACILAARGSERAPPSMSLAESSSLIFCESWQSIS